MISLTHGTIPPDLQITEPYPMSLTAGDLELVAGVINQGIDSHLEAVHATRGADTPNHANLTINDSASMRTLLRRLLELETEEAADFASSIMYTLDYEWI